MEDSRIHNVFACLAKEWGIALAVAGILIAVGALKGSVVDLGFPAQVYPLCIYIGLLIAICPPIAWLVSILMAHLLREVSYPVRCMKRAEIEGLLPLYDRLIGGDRPSLNEMKEIYNANREILRVIEKRTRKGLSISSTIVGFCSVLPITKDAAELIEQERLNGLQMSRQHVCTPKQIPNALYIGSIGADGFTAKGRMLGYLLGVIDDQARHNVRVVYTRPVSKDGLRLARQHDFFPVGQNVGPNELRRVYRLDVPKDSDEGLKIHSNIKRFDKIRIK